MLKIFSFFLSFFRELEFHDFDVLRRQSADFEFVRMDSAKIGYVRFVILLLKVTDQDRLINVEPKLSYSCRSYSNFSDFRKLGFSILEAISHICCTFVDFYVSSFFFFFTYKNKLLHELPIFSIRYFSTFLKFFIFFFRNLFLSK